MEEIVMKRFNFFLVFFGIIVAGAFNAHQQAHLQIILWIGTGLTTLLALTIWRADVRLAYCMRQVYRNHNHVATQAKRGVPWYSFSVRWIIGWFVPLICVILMLTGAILAQKDILTVGLKGEDTVTLNRQDDCSRFHSPQHNPKTSCDPP